MDRIVNQIVINKFLYGNKCFSVWKVVEKDFYAGEFVYPGRNRYSYSHIFYLNFSIFFANLD